MHPLFITALVFAVVTALTMPYYCRITFKGKDQKTLTVKMCLSTLYLLTAILSLFSFRMQRGYMFVMLGAFVLDYIGDYILGKDDRTRSFVTGSACFAAGHILLTVAFSLAEKKLFPSIGWWNGFEFGVFLTIAAVMLLILLIKKTAFDPMLVLMFVYCLTAALMLTKATGLAVRMLPSTHRMWTLPVGALCFLCSDYMLGLQRFKMHRKTFAFKSVCTASYYAAQTLITLSMFTLIMF